MRSSPSASGRSSGRPVTARHRPLFCALCGTLALLLMSVTSLFGVHQSSMTATPMATHQYSRTSMILLELPYLVERTDQAELYESLGISEEVYAESAETTMCIRADRIVALAPTSYTEDEWDSACEVLLDSGHSVVTAAPYAEVMELWKDALRQMHSPS